MLASDTAKTTITKVLKFLIIKDQYQALFLNRFRGTDGYIFGISDDQGANWAVTSFPTHIVIDQDLKVIERLTGYSPDNIKLLENTIDGLLKQL